MCLVVGPELILQKCNNVLKGSGILLIGFDEALVRSKHLARTGDFRIVQYRADHRFFGCRNFRIDL